MIRILFHGNILSTPEKGPEIKDFSRQNPFCYTITAQLQKKSKNQKNPDWRILKQKMRITAKIIRNPYASAVPSD